MLTGMSITALTHATATVPVSNGLFYATAATIIPVLFLAIAVQGRGLNHMLRATTTGPDQPAARKHRNTLLLLPPGILLTAVFVIMSAGFSARQTADAVKKGPVAARRREVVTLRPMTGVIPRWSPYH
jgi:hypothetical protein